MENRAPTSEDAIAIIREVIGHDVFSIERFAAGLSNYVYDVVTDQGRPFVVRIAHPSDESAMVGAVYWSRQLRPRGIRLPRLVHVDLECVTSPFQFVILERLPGTDLGYIYPQLPP